VREFFYGVVLGATAMWLFVHFDAPGVLAFIQRHASAVQSTHGYSH
jgi:hypothetical protein